MQTIPLAPQQRGLYFLHCLAPESAVYNVPVVLRVRGALDGHRLQAAIDRLQARHQALRLTFQEREGEVAQVIHEPGHAAPVIVGHGTAADAQAASLAAQRLAARPFDLANGPLWRVDVVTIGPDDQALVLSFHHIVVDEVSATVVARELAQAYADPHSVPVEGPDYAAFCHDQQAWDPAGLEFWTGKLAGSKAAALPEEYIAEDHGLFAGDRVMFTVDAQDAELLEKVCREHRSSPFMAFHALFCALLHRWTGATDITMGTPMTGRTQTRFAETVGFFQNTVVLRGQAGSGETFAGLLKASRRTVIEALQWQGTPFEAVVEACRPARDASRNPLFQVALTYNRRKVEQDWSLPGLEVTPLPFPWSASHFDLTLSMLQEYGVLKGELAYSAQRFHRETIEQLATAFQVMLSHAIHDTDRPIGELPLTGAEPAPNPVVCTPRQLEMLLDGPIEAAEVAFGGEPVSPRTWQRLKAMPDKRFRHFYAVHGRVVAMGDVAELPRPMAGRPLPGVRLEVLDSNGRPLPPGFFGSIHVDGEPTGDIGRLTAAGHLEIRQDPLEAAMVAHPAVRQAVRVSRGDQTIGVAVCDGEADGAQIRGFLKNRLAGHLVPDHVTIVREIPLTPDGLTDRHTLAARLDAVPPKENDAPAGQTESIIATLFEELLGVPGMGRHDSFFDFGGHSLLAVRLVAAIAQRIGPEVPVGVFMNNPTPALLAARLAEGDLGAGGLVPLRGGSGDRTAVFVHPVGGTLFCYQPLVQALPEGLAVLGFERATRGEKTLDALADTYAKALTAGGPMVVIGWSLGGVIAHAVAGSLVAQGRQVERLVLVDSFVSRTDTDRDQLRQWSTDLALAAATESPQELEVLRRLGIDPQALRQADPAEAAALVDQWRDLLSLVAEHEHRAVDVAASLILAADNPPGYPEAIEASWHGLCRTLSVHRLPGDHFGVLTRPEVVRIVAEGGET